MNDETWPGEPLTEEEQKIVDARMKRAKERIDQVVALGPNPSAEQFLELLRKQNEEDGTMCEHDRSIWSSCIGCEKIEIKLGQREDPEEEPA